MEPLFMDVIGGGGIPSASSSVQVASYARKYAGVPSSFHVVVGQATGALSTIGALAGLLDEAKAAGVRNIVLEGLTAGAAAGSAPAQTPLQGAADALTPTASSSFSSSSSSSSSCAGPVPASLHTSPLSTVVDAVRLVKEHYGDFFCVGVVGYPSSGRGECGSGPKSYAADLSLLVAKVAAGADFVLCRHVLEAAPFLSFLKDATAAGIRVPVIPTVFPLVTYANFQQVNDFCGVAVPRSLAMELLRLRHDQDALVAAGTRAAVAVCKDLLAASVRVLHFITMNLDGPVAAVLRELGLSGPGAASRRKLPWRAAVDEGRAAEEVRPIFWANRPAAYVERTAHWREFPSGRWKTAREDDSAPPFSPLTELHLVPPAAGTPEQRRALWGAAPSDDKHVWSVFAGYVSGKVPRLPWCEKAMLPETSLIASQLVRLNREGFLTINSQPRANGVRSDDPTFGWGGPGGLVYQKAYVECFCPPGHLASLMEAASFIPSVSFTALDSSGTTYSSRRLDGASAVTWAVFPDREVIQPTIVEYGAFKAWKSEAFALWLQQWGAIYEEGSEAGDLIGRIHDEYFLVNVVDNDFISGDIFRVFEDALKLRKEKGDRLPSNVAAGLRVIVVEGGDVDADGGGGVGLGLSTALSSGSTSNAAVVGTGSGTGAGGV
jgi:methylenetetrahydrofolate reductase (NADPH)